MGCTKHRVPIPRQEPQLREDQHDTLSQDELCLADLLSRIASVLTLLVIGLSSCR